MGSFQMFGMIATAKCGRHVLNLKVLRLGTCIGDSLIKRTISKQPIKLTKLAEVGRFEDPKHDGIYETGQLFLHKVFGYRGVVLFPWTARVYDRDRQQESSNNKVPIASKTESNNTSDAKDSTIATPTTNETILTTDVATKSQSTSATENINTDKEFNQRTKTFYQVLIDSRDCPYIRAQTEAVTFLGNQDTNRNLYAIPGLDYVSHDDIWPYSTNERYPLLHELYEKFLQYEPNRDPPFVAKDTLQAWKEKNHPWLELSDVHRETTDNIRVTVIPFYMGCRETPSSSVYWWRYCIRLENMGPLSVQLRERHWRIFSLSGTLETVRGRGVVGQEPILSRRLPAFQYSSHVSLQAPSGHMWGTFRLEREDGHTFDCKIPPFSLESKPDESIPITPPTHSATDTAEGSNKNNTDKKTGSKD